MNLLDEILNFGPNTFLVYDVQTKSNSGLTEYNIAGDNYEDGPNRIDELLLSKYTNVPSPDLPLIFINNFSSSWDSASRACIIPLDGRQLKYGECYQVGCKNRTAWVFGEARLCFHHAKSVWATANWCAVGVLVDLELFSSSQTRSIYLSMYVTTSTDSYNLTRKQRRSSIGHLQFEFEDLNINQQVEEPLVTRKQLLATFVLQDVPFRFSDNITVLTLDTLHNIIHRNENSNIPVLQCLFRSILRNVKTDIIRLKRMYEIIKCFDSDVEENEDENLLNVFDPEQMKYALCRLVDKTSKLITINQYDFNVTM